MEEYQALIRKNSSVNNQMFTQANTAKSFYEDDEVNVVDFKHSC